ncbi:MAG: DUF4920 domain-containing protein [Planctomycetes bacterium]|nr:DUF4920 domain-containing protein [Planctomycetota bacterium]
MKPNLLCNLALAFGLGLAALACSSSGTSQALPAGADFGMPLESRPILHFAMVDATPQKFFDQTLLVEGTVKAVCQQKGCWMQIEENGHVAWVRWETGCGGKFAFPKDSAGKRILVQGSFYPKKISAQDAEHLQQEAGGKIEIASDTYEFNASAVRILD